MTNPRIMEAVQTYLWADSSEASARAQRSMQTEVEVKVERKSDFFLSLDLSLNLPESWWTFSASC
jgi:hypothetical protein